MHANTKGRPLGIAFSKKNSSLIVADATRKAILRISLGNGSISQICNQYDDMDLNGPSDLIITDNDEIIFTDPIRNLDRYDQLEKSCKMLGIKNYACGQFPDNKIDSVPLLELCKFIENSVKNTPDIILTHHPDCLNIDHSLVYRATITSFRPQKGDRLKIYSYYVPSSTDYNPLNMFVANTYVDVKDYKDIKLKCLRECYGSEMREYPHSRSCKNVENLMKVSGAEVGLEYAEKFQLMRGII